MGSAGWCGMIVLLQLCTTASAEDPAFDALHQMLVSNSAIHSIKTGPLTPATSFTGFHNHLSYYVTALYRLGAGPDELTAAYEHASVGMLLPSPRRGLVNDSSWEQRIGSCGCGLVSGRTDLDYLDYYDFYVASIRRRGANGTLATYWPRLASGLAGDVFHAVIQLGYALESGDVDEMTAQGLAWCSTAYAELPHPTAASPPPLRMTPAAALTLLHRDPYPFPRYTQQDDPDGSRCQPVMPDDPHGNVCWNDAIEDLVSNHSSALLRYELEWDDAGNELQQLCRAALLAFAAGGYDDFYLLHLVTGSRAVWAVSNLSGLHLEAMGDTRRAMLTALWRAMLYAFVAKLRPDVSTVVLAPPWRPWSSLAVSARSFTETHLAKMVFTCRDFHERWGDDLYWQVADRVVGLYESGGKFRH